MNEKKINKIKEIFYKTLGIKKDTNIEKLKYGHPKWDSIAHMQLISNLEKKLKISIDVEDVVDMSSFNIAIKIIAKYSK